MPFVLGDKRGKLNQMGGWNKEIKTRITQRGGWEGRTGRRQRTRFASTLGDPELMRARQEGNSEQSSV